MSIQCRNTLSVSEEMLQIILEKYIGKDESGDTVFYFERIIPAGDVSDWYVQTLNKLGTKWVGYDVCVKERCIEFCTEWSPPIHIIKKLAELYKDYVFRLEYHEPDNLLLGVATAQWLHGKVSFNDQCRDEELGNSGRETTANENKINYNGLFDIWADFDDAEAGIEVMRLAEEHGLQPMDALSFMAFCYGYETAFRFNNLPHK